MLHTVYRVCAALFHSIVAKKCYSFMTMVERIIDTPAANAANSQRNVAEMLESGEYFAQARQWYSQLYIAPISQRIQYIMIAGLTGIFMLMAFISLINLLPISPRVPFVIYNSDPITLHPSLTRLKRAQELPDPVFLKFYATAYVERREAYSPSRLLANRAFILQHSDADPARDYSHFIHQNNPQSPIRRFGQTIQRAIIVESVRLPDLEKAENPMQIEVDYVAFEVEAERQQRSLWTAILSINYTALVQRDSFDANIGEYVLDFDAPTFKVLQYQTRERLDAAMQRR
jgi:type IV secretory pathway component VirB8